MRVYVLLENDDYDHTYNVAVTVYSSLSDAVAECNRRNGSVDNQWLYYSVKEYEVW
jgi:hypothetical protein